MQWGFIEKPDEATQKMAVFKAVQYLYDDAIPGIESTSPGHIDEVTTGKGSITLVGHGKWSLLDISLSRHSDYSRVQGKEESSSAPRSESSPGTTRV